eukprot:m.847944 g.847944  ORF g.847944 m.847944 type:complete len:70 (+) comp23487_c2_seq11:94-303(+)
MVMHCHLRAVCTATRTDRTPANQQCDFVAPWDKRAVAATGERSGQRDSHARETIVPLAPVLVSAAEGRV